MSGSTGAQGGPLAGGSVFAAPRLGGGVTCPADRGATAVSGRSFTHLFVSCVDTLAASAKDLLHRLSDNNFLQDYRNLLDACAVQLVIYLWYGLYSIYIFT